MRKKIALLLFFLLFLTSCTESSGSSTETAGTAVYFAAQDPCSEGLAVKSELRTIKGTGEPVEELMDMLLAPPLSKELASPIPADVKVNSWSLDGGVVYLEMSEGYGGLSGINLTIADYCITLTLCQLSQVRSVVISVEGDLIPSRYYQALRISDVLLSDSESESLPSGTTLYFPKAEGSHLGIERREVPAGGGLTRSQAVIDALMQGPESEGLRSLIPKGTRLLSVSTESGVCYVNFSKDMEAGAPEDKLLLYSVVDSLCALSGVDRVQLLIEGEAPRSFGGVNTQKPLEPDFSLVEKD